MIDVHLHTPLTAKGAPDSTENQVLRNAILGAAKHHGVTVALLSGTQDFVDSWMDADGIRLLPTARR